MIRLIGVFLLGVYVGQEFKNIPNINKQLKKQRYIIYYREIMKKLWMLIKKRIKNGFKVFIIKKKILL